MDIEYIFHLIIGDCQHEETKDAANQVVQGLRAQLSLSECIRLDEMLLAYSAQFMGFCSQVNYN